MMFLLFCYVIAHRRRLRRTDGERAVSLLPLERPFADFAMHPSGRDRFDLAHDIGKAMRGFQSDEQMHVIGHATDGLGNSVHVLNDATEERMQPFAPCGNDQRYAILG